MTEASWRERLWEAVVETASWGIALIAFFGLLVIAALEAYKTRRRKDRT